MFCVLHIYILIFVIYVYIIYKHIKIQIYFCLFVCSVPQSCLTLCSPMDCSLPDSNVHGIFPGKNTRVVCHALGQGIFPTQGSSLWLLSLQHWQADSLPLAPPGTPKIYLYVNVYNIYIYLHIFSYIYNLA